VVAPEVLVGRLKVVAAAEGAELLVGVRLPASVVRHVARRVPFLPPRWKYRSAKYLGIHIKIVCFW
jgi:hypothetical protein